jgi:hypothetical protein
MGILDDYLGGVEEKTATPSIKGSGIINDYLSGEPEKPKRIYVSPIRPPISGVSKEESDIINAEPGIKGGANPRDRALIEGIKNLPANVGNSIAEDFKGGTSEVGTGVSQILNNQPASGVGNIVMGGLRAAVSPVSGTAKEVIEKPVTELTGSPRIGEAASMVATSGLPLVKAGSSVVKSLPKNKALSTLVDRIGADNLPEVVKEMKANPRLTPADLSPAVKQDTQHLFVTEGPHQNYLADVVEQRLGSAKGAVENALDQHLGTTVNAVDKLKELKQNIRDVGSKQIEPAVSFASPVNISPVIKYIDSRIKPGVQSVISSGALPNTAINQEIAKIRNVLTDDKSMRFSAKDLHDVQSVLRHEADNLLNSANGQDRRMGKALMDVRNQVVDAIDAASPQVNGKGTYKAALSNYRDEFHIQDAFQHGHDAIIKNSRSMESRPEFFKEWLDKASPEEINAAKEGARVAIDTQIHGFRTAATNPANQGVNMSQVDFNRDRIEALFGKTEADKLFTKLEHERKIADTNNKLVQGSQTAMRAASKAAFELPKASDLAGSLIPPALLEGASALASGTPFVGSAAYGAIKGASYIKDAIAMKLAKEHNARYAKYALPTEGPDRNALIQQLDAIANAPPKKSLLSRGAGLARLIAP